MKWLTLLLFLILVTEASHILAQDRPPNFLVLIGDDMGVETLSSYGIGTPTAITPNLDQLAEDGVRFENFWTEPICSPSRADILTGRYPFRHGVPGPLFSFWGRMGEISNSRALRNSKYKLIIGNGTEELYHIAEDPAELNPLDLANLAEPERSHYQALKAQLEVLN